MAPSVVTVKTAKDSRQRLHAKRLRRALPARDAVRQPLLADAIGPSNRRLAVERIRRSSEPIAIGELVVVDDNHKVEIRSAALGGMRLVDPPAAPASARYRNRGRKGGEAACRGKAGGERRPPPCSCAGAPTPPQRPTCRRDRAAACHRCPDKNRNVQPSGSVRAILPRGASCRSGQGAEFAFCVLRCPIA